MARYWREVRAVQALTGAQSRDARRAVRDLRTRGIATATDAKRHPRIVQTAVDAAIAARQGPYTGLADWLDAWDAWDGEYDEYDIESGVDTGGGDEA